MPWNEMTKGEASRLASGLYFIVRSPAAFLFASKTYFPARIKSPNKHGWDIEEETSRMKIDCQIEWDKHLRTERMCVQSQTLSGIEHYSWPSVKMN